jgi:hypothetical protein
MSVGIIQGFDKAIVLFWNRFFLSKTVTEPACFLAGLTPDINGMENDFQKTIGLLISPKDALRMITHRVHDWWTTDFEGSAGSLGDVFTVRFGNTFKTMRVVHFEPDKCVEWMCIDQHIEMPEDMDQLENSREWVGSVIRWEVKPDGQQSRLTLTHFGLTPQAECWIVCEPGWNQSLGSIESLAKFGIGRPFVRLDDKHLKQARKNLRGRNKVL